MAALVFFSVNSYIFHKMLTYITAKKSAKAAQMSPICSTHFYALVPLCAAGVENVQEKDPLLFKKKVWFYFNIHVKYCRRK